MIALFKYMAQHLGQIADLLMEHVQMTAIAVGFAIVIGVPLGILISYVKKLDKPIIGVANVVQAIPSMALLVLALRFWVSEFFQQLSWLSSIRYYRL